MNIFKKISILLAINKSIQEVQAVADEIKKEDVKPVVKKENPLKSRRFWMTILTQAINVLGVVKGVIPVQAGIIAGVVLQSIYTIMSTLEHSPEITTVIDASKTETK